MVSDRRPLELTIRVDGKSLFQRRFALPKHAYSPIEEGERSEKLFEKLILCALRAHKINFSNSF
jgi:hypothetical protein